MPERHVTEILDEVFRRAGMKRGLKRAEAVLLWPRVVGADVARFASARALRDGVLYIDVSDAETAMHLGLQRRRFLAVYHDTYRAHEVKDIRFQVGAAANAATDPGAGASRRGDANADAAAAAAARPDAAELAELARQIGAMDLPDDVAAAALRAGRSLLAMRARQRAEGWHACPTCGALHDGAVRPDTPRERTLRTSGRLGAEERRDRELCPACRRASHEPRVRAAAQRLATRPSVPTPGLAEEERAVAVRLATEYLDGVLTELLPIALADPSARDHLERAARCRVALEHGKELDDVDDDDLARLPAAVRRLLGGGW
ncbi:MAG: DUF721 domain-containing protein [Trueperaceae bacterium]